jgi:hypothetical protein
MKFTAEIAGNITFSEYGVPQSDGEKWSILD